MSEWLISLMLLGFFKNIITIIFGAIAIYILYSVNILHIGFQMLPYVFALIVAGWWSGLLSAAIIVYFGQRMQMMAWIAGYIFYPFCAVIYPVTALPSWAKTISSALPMTYIFEGLRHSFTGYGFDYHGYLKAMTLNLMYLALALVVFFYSFRQSRVNGLARLE
jgi:ABC-2 type transport system permease protein